MKHYRIRIEGTVQGVGFRPFIYRLAHDLRIRGEVYNDGEGVVIRCECDEATLRRFIARIEDDAPMLARIDTLRYEEERTACAYETFRIVDSKEGAEISVRIPPDTSVCAACEAELFDPQNRRYGYPFITCTECGVRYTIIDALPYDRRHTTMRFFKMCKACEKEYADPLDRRYHAQPIGCWECGPALKWIVGGRTVLDAHEASDRREVSARIIANAAETIAKGGIVAVKGAGGYHLMCDATNEEAVARLRTRKRRPHKPFAVMVPDMYTANALAFIDETQARLLDSAERPVVLLDAKSDTILAPNVAPDVATVGLFLPYTPLHLLLMRRLRRPVVATSANYSDEPIATDLTQLLKLEGVYDAVLEHDRAIANGCDDSVVTSVGERVMILRRARGYAPASVKLPFRLASSVFAAGAQQKNTFALGFENQAILSPHIGDLGGIEADAYYRAQAKKLMRLYRFVPDVLAHDAHPRYRATEIGKELCGDAAQQVALQHHRAHLWATAAEHHISETFFGVAFDGTGYGDDATIWGGEWFVGDFTELKRIGHLRPFALLGAERAVKEPRRVALALLFEAYGKEAFKLDTPTLQAFDKNELRTLYTMWEKGLNAPRTSSMGRLFDGVASLLGILQVLSYEGQSGMMAEALYDARYKEPYEFSISEKGEVDIRPMIRALAQERDKRRGVSRFMHTVAEITRKLYAPYEGMPLVCGGGVFQNRVLVSIFDDVFSSPFLPRDVPPNDGAIALGQIAGCYGRI
jgi:hydrogenase maturation protein HypF